VPDRGGASDGAKQALRRAAAQRQPQQGCAQGRATPTGRSGAAPDSTTGTSPILQSRAIHTRAPQAAGWQRPLTTWPPASPSPVCRTTDTAIAAGHDTRTKTGTAPRSALKSWAIIGLVFGLRV
jgi:hypothetical protein